MQKPQVRIDHGPYGWCDVTIVALAPDVTVESSRRGYGHHLSDNGDWELEVKLVGNQGGELWVAAMLVEIDGRITVQNEVFRNIDDTIIPQLVAAKINAVKGEGFAVPVDPAAARADEARGFRSRAAELRQEAEKLERRAQERERMESRSEV